MQCEKILQVANAYASIGWHVIPTYGKIPQGGNEWQHKATTANIEKLFSGCSFDGVGVLLGEKSGIVDIECDDEEAENALLILFNGEYPTTPTFQSTRGKHFIFNWAEGLPKTSVFKIGKLEFRIGNGAAAQTVFPPSNGRKWIIEPSVKAIDFPHWKEIVKRHEEIRKPKKFKPRDGLNTPFYGDNETLNVPRWLEKHSMLILDRDNGRDGATRWFIECPNIDKHTTANAIRDCCVTQEQTGKLGGKCFHQSCGMDSWDSLRSRIGELEYSDFHEEKTDEVNPVNLDNFMVEKTIIEPEPEKPTEPKKPLNPFPVECLEVPGLIGEIMQYNARTAIYPRTELALAGALALMSVITGRKIADRWGLRTNAYFVGLCNSGGGKAHAKQINSRILGTIGKDSMIMAKPKSGSGLVSSLRDSPASLLQVDELADWLEIMKNPQKSPHTYEILGLMKEVYSESKTESWKPAGYADAKKNPVINSPHMAFYGVAPMQVFWQSLTKQNLTDGLVGRLLTIESTTENISNDEMADDPPPDSLLNAVKTWIDFAPGDGNLTSINYRVAKLQHTGEAWKRYREHGKRTEKRRPYESEEAYAIWCRTPEKTGKLALLRACSRVLPVGGVLPVVEVDDVEWAIKLSNWVARTMIERAGLYVAENLVENNLLRLLRLCENWIGKNQLTRKTQWLKTRERDELIRDAITSERLEQRAVETNGAPRLEYRTVS